MVNNDLCSPTDSEFMQMTSSKLINESVCSKISKRGKSNGKISNYGKGRVNDKKPNC
jgi:hypothetical protein